MFARQGKRGEVVIELLKVRELSRGAGVLVVTIEATEARRQHAVDRLPFGDLAAGFAMAGDAARGE